MIYIYNNVYQLKVRDNSVEVSQPDTQTSVIYLITIISILALFM